MTSAQEWLDTAPHPGAVAAAQGKGLEVRRVDAAEAAGWFRVVARTFTEGEPSAENLEASVARNAQRRLLGVFDASSPIAEEPVGTVASWVGEISLPGAVAIDGVAISAVSVAQTHRRRGIARIMLEGELRAAAENGSALAMLTVSESSIYGRYGFGVATIASTVTVKTRELTWTGRTPGGRLDTIRREDARDELLDVHERARRDIPGEVSSPPGADDRFTGTAPDAHEAEKIRAVRYADADGTTQGVLTYRVSGGRDARSKNTASVIAFVAATADAEAALWRYLLDLDLVDTVNASLLSPDPVLLWMVDDPRAIESTPIDHHYVRILDVERVLSSRRYARPGTVRLDVSDPLDLAGGSYVLTVDADGRGVVSRATEADRDLPAVALDIAELSSIAFGSVNLWTLERAGRVSGDGVEAAASLFLWHVPARLSFWY